MAMEIVMILIYTLALSLIVSLMYKFLINQEEMKKIKEEMNYFKEKADEAKRNGDTAKMSQHTSDMLKVSSRQFKQTMKPMFASMFVFILVLGVIGSIFSGISVDLETNPDATFSYGDAEHRVYYEKIENAEGTNMKTGVDFNNDGEFSDDEIFNQYEVFSYEDMLWSPRSPKENVVHFDMLVAETPFPIPFIGRFISWFWWYIIIAIPATMTFRKLMGVM